MAHTVTAQQQRIANILRYLLGHVEADISGQGGTDKGA